VAGSGILTLPTGTSNLISASSTDTLTNKTLTSPTITGVTTDSSWKYRLNRYDFEGTNNDLVTYDWVRGPNGLTNGAVISTTQFKFGSSSLSCSGGATSALPQLVFSLPPNGINTANFCIECWIYPTSFTNSSFPGIFELGAGTTTARVALYFASSTTATLRINSTSNTLTLSTIGISLNTWSHIALERTSTGANGLTLYVNGVSAGSFTFATSIPSTWSGWIASTFDGYALQGYLDDFRLSAGITVYGTAFTPPTAALPISPYTITGMGPIGL
jgi:hypothetical protein